MKKLILFMSICMMLFSTQLAFANENLPNIRILATGGTIAGSAPSNTQMSGYKAGSIGIQVLLKAVPEINQYANVSGEQVCNISSNNLTEDILLNLAKRVNEVLDDSNADGVVITHGTDTLEETAYFLNLVVKSNKPVVIVGAMRPATAISADGPVNLLNAVRLAGSKEARGKGVLVAMNDEINGARDVTKTNTTHVSTFKAPELGYLGYINNGVPCFYRESTRKHTTDTEFNIKNLQKLPKVRIVYSYVGEDRDFIDNAVEKGAEGIIYVGTGDGSINEASEAALVEAQKKGVVIVRSSRCGNGTVLSSVPRWDDEHFLSGDNLSPQKARLLLALALTKTHDSNKIQEMFNIY